MAISESVSYSATEQARTVAEASPSQWLSFRGDPQCQGVAPGRLPDAFKLLWTFKTQESIKSSAVIAGDSVFVGSDDGNLYALQRTTGTRLWILNTEGPVEAPPLVVADQLFVGSDDGNLYAVNRHNGQRLWTYTTFDRIVGSATRARAPDGKSILVLIGSYDNHLHCIDARTGEMRWKFETENFVNGSAALWGNHAVFGGCDNHLYIVSIDNGELVNRIDLSAPVAGTAAVHGRFAYVGHYGNQFVRADLVDHEIDWFFEDKAFPFFSSAAVSGERVVFGSRAKRVYCVNRQDGKMVWQFKTRGGVDSSPVICGNKVVVGSDDGRLYVLNLDSGEMIWSYEIGEAITASPAVADGMIVIGAEDGLVYAFGPREQSPLAEKINEE